MSHTLSQRFFVGVLLLSPALLLWTPNLTVGVVAAAIIFSIVYLIKHRAKISINQLDLAVILCFSAYLIANIPVAIIDGDTFRYFKGPSRFILCIPVYLALKMVIRNADDFIKPMELGVAIGSLGALGIALYQFYILDMPRVDGFLFSINFGYLSCSLAFLSLCLSIDSENKLILRVAFLAAAIATLLTFTRGAIFAIPLLLCFMAVLNWKKLGLRRILAACLIFLLSSFTTYNLSDSFQGRIDYTITEFTNIAKGQVAKSTSSGGRVQLWEAASYAFKQNPILGSTYEEREAFNQELYQQGEVTSWVLTVSRGHAHSQYFEMLASNGLLGLIAILLVLVAPLAHFTNLYIKHGGRIALTGSVFIAGFMIYGLTEAPLQANLISTFFAFMLAVFFVLTQKEQSCAADNSRSTNK